MQIGLVVNPIAGMGGTVGLKGTDGPDTVAEAQRRGAVARAGERAREALALLASRHPGAEIVTARGALGEDWIAGLDLAAKVVDVPKRSQTARDTKEAIEAMGDLELILFAGGDGTARDVMAAAPGTPLLGIPAGVKMHSGVFAVTPRAAGALVSDVISSPERVRWHEAEVMDIDEAELRQGRISPRLYGLAITPVSRSLMQAAKGGPAPDAEGAIKGAARDIAEAMQPELLYVIGPGRSAGAVMEALGHSPTILGVDALLSGSVVALDATAADLRKMSQDHDIALVLGVTGKQGFLLGRGNQQIDTDLIRKAGRDGLIVIATPEKLATLNSPRLLVDTGDAALDSELEGYTRVNTGKGRRTMMRIGSA